MSGHEDNHDVRFEGTDVDAAALLKYGFALVVTTAVVVAVLWRLYFVFVAQEAARQPPPPIMKSDPEAMAAPPPNLQTRPVQDFQAFRARENGVLDSYGWVDKNAGVVRIPIDEAMRLLVERGIAPVKPAAAEAAAKPGAAKATGQKAPAAKPSPGANPAAGSEERR